MLEALASEWIVANRDEFVKTDLAALSQSLADIIRAAVAEEREACAHIAEAGGGNAAGFVAAAIRARG